MDKLAETFVPTSAQSPSSINNPGSCLDGNISEGSDTPAPDRFTSVCAISMPLVKLLPSLLSMVEEEEGDDEDGVAEYGVQQDEWIQHIISKFQYI